MFELLIDKQIGEGWFSEGITPAFVREELAKAGSGEDVRITINSPGGDLWDCIAIYNVIRDFARQHNDITITTYIQGMAASAASVIALAAHSVSYKNKIIVEDNSIYMIHNAWAVVIGDRNEMRMNADAMERTDDLMAACYSGRSGKDIKTVKKLMDDETWYFGKEIVEAGFADEVITNDDSEEITENTFVAMRNSSVLKAQARVIEIQNTMKKNADKTRSASARIAACLTMEDTGSGQSRPDKSNTGGCKMTAEELKKNNPDVYAAIVKEGEAAGRKAESERAARFLAMGNKCGAMDYALECIKENRDPADATVIDAFMDKKVAAEALAAQKQDEGKIPNVTPPKDNEKQDDDAIMAAFHKELGMRGEQ